MAVGILVEELIREQMRSWYLTGFPLTFDGQEDTLKAACRAQLSGSCYLEDNLIIGVLKNRLEVRINYYFIDLLLMYVFFLWHVRRCLG